MTNLIEGAFKHQKGDFELDVAFKLPARGITALFGHSGCGKTTLLRCIAGLEQTQGFLMVNDHCWQDERFFLPVHKRPLGFVFQEASLFTHLNVEQNLSYGYKRIPASARKITMEQAIGWLGIANLLSRSPEHLSGGERQRVAIARTLLTSPSLLLMDEPLSALDEKSKQEIFPYLSRLHDELSIPILYVSHSVKEVARLADNIIWMDAGKIKDTGSVQAVLTNLELAITFEEDASSVLDSTVIGHEKDYHLTILESHFGRLWVKQMDKREGERVKVNIPARDVSLSKDKEENSSILNIWKATIVEMADAGPGQVIIKLCGSQAADQQPLLARITKKSREKMQLAIGQQLYARIKSVGLLE
jgi:molybdate transport system ATP-binding protein